MERTDSLRPTQQMISKLSLIVGDSLNAISHSNWIQVQVLIPTKHPRVVPGKGETMRAVYGLGLKYHVGVVLRTPGVIKGAQQAFSVAGSAERERRGPGGTST